MWTVSLFFNMMLWLFVIVICQHPQWRIFTCSSVFALIYLQKHSAGQDEQELLSLLMITWITFLHLYFLLWSRKKGAFIVPSNGLSGKEKRSRHKIFWWSFIRLLSLKELSLSLFLSYLLSSDFDQTTSTWTRCRSVKHLHDQQYLLMFIKRKGKLVGPSSDWYVFSCWK